MTRCILQAILILMISTAVVLAEDYVSLNEKGNKAFAEKKYGEALDFYRDAEIEKPETPAIQYNHGNTLLEAGRFKEALEKYNHSLVTDDVSLQSRVLYNTGNGYFIQQNYQKAIEAYQKTLDITPDDLDAKYNLELARVRLREQMQNQKQDQQQQDQDQQEQDQQEQEQKQEQPQQQDEEQEQQQQQEQQQNQQQNENPEDEEQKQQPQPQEVNPADMPKEDAERILNALENQEKENQEKQRRFKVSGKYTGSDW